MRDDNPYHANGYVSPDLPRYADLYIERSGIDDLVLGRLNRGSGPLGSYIYGPRQCGKTSLLYHLMWKTRQIAWSAVHVCLRPTQTGREQTWYRQLWEQLLEGLGVPDSPYPSCAFDLSSCLRRLNDRICGLGVLVVWDELDALLTDSSERRAAAQFLAELRALKQSDYGTPFVRWAFVMAALRPPDVFYREIASDWTDHNSPPFNHLQTVQVHDWAVSDTEHLGQLLTPTHSLREGTLQRVHWWTGGHPYLSQRLLGWLYDQEKQELSSADVDYGAAEVRRDQGHMIQHLGRHVKDLNGVQRSILKNTLNASHGWNESLDEQRYLEMLGFIKQDPSTNLAIVRNPLYWEFLDQALAEPEKKQCEELPLHFGAHNPAMPLQIGIALLSLLLGMGAGVSILHLGAVQVWLSAALAACISKGPFCTAGLFTIGLVGIMTVLGYLIAYLLIWHRCVNSKRDWTYKEIDETARSGPRLTLGFGQTVVPDATWKVKTELDPKYKNLVSIEAEGDQIEPVQRSCTLTTASLQGEIHLICRRGSRMRDLLFPWPSRWNVVLHVKWTAHARDGMFDCARPVRIPVIVDSSMALPRLVSTALKKVAGMAGDVLKSILGSNKTT